MHKKISLILSTLVIFSCFCASAGEVDLEAEICDAHTIAEFDISRATNSFNMSIGAGKRANARNEFPLSAGETVRIRANYEPASASVDFGLVDDNGTFYYVNTTSGSVDQNIRIPNNGTYRLAVRNNSNRDITVSGIVRY